MRNLHTFPSNFAVNLKLLYKIKSTKKKFKESKKVLCFLLKGFVFLFLYLSYCFIKNESKNASGTKHFPAKVKRNWIPPILYVFSENINKWKERK